MNLAGQLSSPATSRKYITMIKLMTFWLLSPRLQDKASTQFALHNDEADHRKVYAAGHYIYHSCAFSPLPFHLNRPDLRASSQSLPLLFAGVTVFLLPTGDEQWRWWCWGSSSREDAGGEPPVGTVEASGSGGPRIQRLGIRNRQG